MKRRDPGNEVGSISEIFLDKFDSSGSIPGLGVICGLSLLLVLVLAPRGFSLGTPVFPSPQKTNTSKFQFNLESVPN